MNTYPECKMCGECCNIEVIAMTIDEAQAIFDYIEENGIEPRENAMSYCPFREHDGSCRIYPARPQTCRLHNCTTPLGRILDEHPEIVPLDDKYYVDMRKVFLYGDFVDPRADAAEADRCSLTDKPTDKEQACLRSQ